MLNLFRSGSDAVNEAYRGYLLTLRNYAVFFLILLAIALFVGVPHIQTTYKFTGPMPKDRIPRAEQKIEAWYFGPSRGGFQLVRAGQYGHRGCPYILFIPLTDCFSLSRQSDW